ncbi:MAG: J domain-containing protein [Pseudomonadota bacterium]
MAGTVDHAARVLGLEVEATASEIRRVRRELALKYHPDVTTDQARATRHMARINAAADTLLAHLNAASATGRQPRYEDFSSVRPRARKARPTGAGRAQAATQQSACHTQKAAPETARSKASHSVVQPSHKPAHATAKANLMRFASSSYAKVLDQIGNATAGPNIDVRVLKFQS